MEEITSFLSDHSGIIVLILLLCGAIYFLYLKTFPKKAVKEETPKETTPIEKPEPEPFLIHCPACGAEISRYAPTCLKCGHPICPTNPDHNKTATHNQTVINISNSEKKEAKGGCLWSLLGLIILIVAYIFFNVIGYFIALFILTLCGVFKAGEAISLFIIGIILILLLPFLGIISLGALFLS